MPNPTTGIVATWGRIAVVTGVAVLQTPLLFRCLPPSELGIWYLFFSIAVLVNLSDLGLPSAFSRAASYRWGREKAASPHSETERSATLDAYGAISLGDLYSSAFLATLLMALVFCIPCFPAALAYFRGITAEGKLPPSLALSTGIFLAGVVLNLAAAIPGACLSGFGDVSLDNGIRGGVAVIGYAMMVVFLPAHPHLTTLSAIYLFQGALSFIVSHSFVASRRNFSFVVPGVPEPKAIVQLYKDSAPIFVSRIGVWLVLECNLLIAGYFLGSEKVPDYAVLRQIVAMGASLISAIPIALTPHAAAAHSGGESKAVISYYLGALRIGNALNVLWMIGLLVFTPSIIELWIGADHVLGIGVLVPIALASFLELHASIHAFFVWTIGRWPFAPASAIGGVLNVFLASIGCWAFGLAGLSWGSLLALSVPGYWYPARYAVREVGGDDVKYFSQVIMPLAAYAGIVAPVVYGLSRMLDWLGRTHFHGRMSQRATMGFSLSIAIAFSFAFAAAVAWTLVLSNENRQTIRDFIGTTMGRNQRESK
jgi:O-antigen/teichoic acid export membrane protein